MPHSTLSGSCLQAPDRKQLAKRAQILLTLCCFLTTPFFIGTLQAAHAAVVINEIFPKPSDEISEWIELYNNGTEPVALDGWKLQNFKGTPSFYVIPTGTTIQPHDFLSFFHIQTNIQLNNEGDTVLLSDVTGAQIDSQSYPSILGFNTSMGRSVDGAGVWSLCIAHSYNSTNTCPAPTNTPTTTPSPTISVTPYPLEIVTSSPKPMTETPPLAAGLNNVTAKTPPAETNSINTQSYAFGIRLSNALMGAGIVGITLLIVFWGIHRWFKHHD